MTGKDVGVLQNHCGYFSGSRIREGKGDGKEGVGF